MFTNQLRLVRSFALLLTCGLLPGLVLPSFALAGQRVAKGTESRPDALYHNYCSVCHGDRGDGRSRAQNSLNPPPRDFTSAGELSRETMIVITTHGKPGTAMVGWKTQLSAAEIESVVDYVRKTFMVVALDPRAAWKVNLCSELHRLPRPSWSGKHPAHRRLEACARPIVATGTRRAHTRADGLRRNNRKAWIGNGGIRKPAAGIRY
jgi:mono/diheme cytochrome c family protein